MRKLAEQAPNHRRQWHRENFLQDESKFGILGVEHKLQKDAYTESNQLKQLILEATGVILVGFGGPDGN